MVEQPVHEVLAEWREAERQLAVADDPDTIAALETRIAELRERYRVVVAEAAVHIGHATGTTVPVIGDTTDVPGSRS